VTFGLPSKRFLPEHPPMRIAFFTFVGVCFGLFAPSLPAAPPEGVAERATWTEAQWEEALAPYRAKARASLPEAVRRFQRAQGTENPGGLLLFTRRPGKDGASVEIAMEVTEVGASGIFFGTVRGGQEENSPVSAGDTLGIVASDVYDWALRPPRGKPEGLLVRRARMAIESGVMAVIFTIQADPKGRLVHLEMSRAVSLPTGEDITDLLPPGVEADGSAHLREFYRTQKVPRRIAEASLYYTFPAGERLREDAGG
jgi:hypothetical protein